MSCDLVLIGRGSQFRFIAGDDEADDTSEEGLERLSLPGCRCTARRPPAEGPAIIAYDGSLQADHALTAFQATGLAESTRDAYSQRGPTTTEDGEQAENGSCVP